MNLFYYKMPLVVIKHGYDNINSTNKVQNKLLHQMIENSFKRICTVVSYSIVEDKQICKHSLRNKANAKTNLSKDRKARLLNHCTHVLLN